MFRIGLAILVNNAQPAQDDFLPPAFWLLAIITKLEVSRSDTDEKDDVEIVKIIGRKSANLASGKDYRVSFLPDRPLAV